MRRPWQLMSAVALVLAAAAILFSAFLYARIQNERADNIKANCVASNERHDQTIEALDKVINQLPPGARRARALGSRPGTVLIVEALAPKRDCAALVQQQVHKP